jgi:hypothetical protein
MTISINISNSVFEDNDKEFFEDNNEIQPKSSKVSPQLKRVLNKYRQPSNNSSN